MTPDRPAIQDFYPEDAAHCYGCGRLNDRGLRIRNLGAGTQVLPAVSP